MTTRDSKSIPVTDYFDELLGRIRDIRSYEKLLYKRVRDICALSIDYDPELEPQTHFFVVAQNKFHFAVTGMTTAEILLKRADAALPNVGAQTWSGGALRKKDAATAQKLLTARRDRHTESTGGSVS